MGEYTSVSMRERTEGGWRGLEGMVVDISTTGSTSHYLAVSRVLRTQITREGEKVEDRGAEESGYYLFWQLWRWC